jgi:hypothetical protein
MYHLRKCSIHFMNRRRFPAGGPVRLWRTMSAATKNMARAPCRLKPVTHKTGTQAPGCSVNEAKQA